MATFTPVKQKMQGGHDLTRYGGDNIWLRWWGPEIFTPHDIKAADLDVPCLQLDGTPPPLSVYGQDVQVFVD
jgi:hypothetical protein